MHITALLLTLLLSLTAYAETKCDDISLFRAVDQSQLSFWERTALKNEIMERCWGKGNTNDSRQGSTKGSRQRNASDWKENPVNIQQYTGNGNSKTPLKGKIVKIMDGEISSLDVIYLILSLAVFLFVIAIFNKFYRGYISKLNKNSDL
ncbi:MAG: hypothetical protein OXI88_08020 [Gammaproteobacteria bacterium]|nr:hypothetical protein [Gammaproteobacteria bacterium]